MVPRPVTSINPPQSRPPSQPGASLKKRVRLNHDIDEYEKSDQEESEDEDQLLRHFSSKKREEQNTQEMLEDFDRPSSGRNRFKGGVSSQEDPVFSQESQMHVIGGYNTN